MENLSIGDVVRLNSGSDEMTVLSKSNHDSVECGWFQVTNIFDIPPDGQRKQYASEWHSGRFPAACLKRVSG